MAQYDLDAMSLENLNRLKQEEEGKLQAVTKHYGQLRQAQAKFVSSKETLATMKTTPQCEGKEIMVPLTQSLYVPGKVKNAGNVIIELGTGFYAEKSITQATNFLDRKIKLVGDNAAQIFNAVQMTRKNIEAIIMVMQQKISALNQGGGGGGGGGGEE
jgi:prefoldin alpha subunit